MTCSKLTGLLRRVIAFTLGAFVAVISDGWAGKAADCQMVKLCVKL